MKLPSANEVMLRINDVALRANGHAFGVIWSECPPQFPTTVLHSPLIYAILTTERRYCYEETRYSHYCCNVGYISFNAHCYGHDVYALFRIKEQDMSKNKNFFWIICIVTAVGAIYWSAMSLLQQSRPIFIAFLIVNIAVLIINIVCLIIDKKTKH